MKQIGAAKFKQECLSVLDRLSREGIVILLHALTGDLTAKEQKILENNVWSI